jgi:hypothetical protein
MNRDKELTPEEVEELFEVLKEKLTRKELNMLRLLTVGDMDANEHLVYLIEHYLVEPL